MRSDRGSTAPDHAFWLLSDETRINILRAVWNAPTDTISFESIRERLGNPDSGRFNYHLNKLTDHFLTKTDDGYSLSQAGREVLRAVFAGTLTEHPRLEPGEIAGECIDCGASLVAEYDEYGIIECGECGATVMWNEFPPAGLEGRDAESFSCAFDQWTRHRFRLAMTGICPNCANDMVREKPDGIDANRESLAILHLCPNCKYQARIPLFGHVVYHPAISSIYYESGLNISSLPYWELQAITREYTEEIRSVEPWVAVITIKVGNQAIEVTLDEDLTITEVDMLD